MEVVNFRVVIWLNTMRPHQTFGIKDVKTITFYRNGAWKAAIACETLKQKNDLIYLFRMDFFHPIMIHQEALHDAWSIIIILRVTVI